MTGTIASDCLHPSRPAASLPSAETVAWMRGRGTDYDTDHILAIARVACLAISAAGAIGTVALLCIQMF